ncbi:hypothetical protein CS542_02830 [Pedobacter sp. IW39]|nr:hypothetical protein CS542_02830 [Pedobacter sp. IW39]
MCTDWFLLPYFNQKKRSTVTACLGIQYSNLKSSAQSMFYDAEQFVTERPFFKTCLIQSRPYSGRT